MIKNILTSFGIGSSKLDLILDKEDFSPGDKITGKILISGGNSDQYIDKINLSFFTNVQDLGDKNISDYNFETTSEPKEIGFRKINEAFTLRINENKEILFETTLPFNLPLTTFKDDTSVWIKSSLDIAYAKDPIDNDKINIHPSETTMRIIELIKEIGFKHKGTYVIKRKDFEWGVAQIHKFIPKQNVQDKKFGIIDEIDIIMKLPTLKGEVS